MNNRGRELFYVLGGGYLLYLAYKLLLTVKNQESNNPVLLLVFGVIFGIGGIGILIYAYKMYRNESHREQEGGHEEKELEGKREEKGKGGEDGNPKA